MCRRSQTAYLQNLIGILRWIVELGRTHIIFEVSLLSKFLVLPCAGHLPQALHIFKYLDMHQDNDLAFDTMYHNAEIIDAMKE